MRVTLFTVNYCLFAHGDVSIRFNGKNDNVVLEFDLMCMLGDKITIQPHYNMPHYNVVFNMLCYGCQNDYLPL